MHGNLSVINHSNYNCYIYAILKFYSDHSLVCCKLKLQAKYFYRTKQPGKPRIDISKMSKPDLIQQFNSTLNKKLVSTLTEKSALRKWDKVRNTGFVHKHFQI